MTVLACRFCEAPLTETFVDLGVSPLANSYVSPQKASHGETFYPLHARVCSKCMLVQLEQFETPEEIFSDYLYFSSYSESWLAHCKAYTKAMTERFGLDASSQVIEIASNDGYLLQYFAKAGVRVLGVEPAANVAEFALKRDVPTEVAFFGRETATRLRNAGARADLMVANNVLAHVPDVNDFVAGFKILLKEGGVTTFEFPHLLKLILENQFDTIYHEHFSYLSLYVVSQILSKHGLRVFDVEQLPTHGGSLRVFACHDDDYPHAATPAVQEVLDLETAQGLTTIDGYRDFMREVTRVKCDLMDFLIQAIRDNKTVAAYGAAAKGNTLLNYCGVGPDFIRFTCDRNPHKQNHFLPGTRIPIFSPEAIESEKPDYVLILPWNLRQEVMEQLKAIREWGGRFIIPIPRLLVC